MFFWSAHVVEQLLHSIVLSILILTFFYFLGPLWAIFGVKVGFKNCFGVSLYKLITFVFRVLLYFLSYHLVLSLWCCGGGWYSKWLLSLNPTTVLVFLLFELWLSLGCDNAQDLSIDKSRPFYFKFDLSGTFLAQ